MILFYFYIIRRYNTSMNKDRNTSKISKGSDIHPEGPDGRWLFLAPACVISAGILWGIIGLFSNSLAASGFSPIQITFLRSLITAIVLAFFMLTKSPSLLRIRLRDIWMFLGTGICSIAFFNICYFTCISLSTLSTACTLLYTGPCFVMLISCLVFKERFTKRKGIALICAVTGCAFVTGFIGGGAFMSVPALLTGLGSGLGYGLYSIFGAVALKKYDPFTVTLYTFIIAALALLPVCDVAGIASMTFSAGHTVHTICMMLLLGVLSTLMPFVLYTKGLEHMETGRASVLTFVEPLCATLISITVFREPFGMNHAVGMAAIIAAVIILNLPEKRNAAS